MGYLIWAPHAVARCPYGAGSIKKVRVIVQGESKRVAAQRDAAPLRPCLDLSKLKLDSREPSGDSERGRQVCARMRHVSVKVGRARAGTMRAEGKTRIICGCFTTPRGVTDRTRIRARGSHALR